MQQHESNIENEDSYEQLVAIIEDHFPSKEKVNRQTVLQSLNYNGVDAMYLMKAIFEAFPIDWREFKYLDYFYNEPGWGNEEKIELKIGELHDAIRVGVWKNPVPDNRKRIEIQDIKLSTIFILTILTVVLLLLLIAWIMITRHVRIWSCQISEKNFFEMNRSLLFGNMPRTFLHNPAIQIQQRRLLNGTASKLTQPPISHNYR
jgi:hypothetical protein